MLRVQAIACENIDINVTIPAFAFKTVFDVPFLSLTSRLEQNSDLTLIESIIMRLAFCVIFIVSCSFLVAYSNTRPCSYIFVLISIKRFIVPHYPCSYNFTCT